MYDEIEVNLFCSSRCSQQTVLTHSQRAWLAWRAPKILFDDDEIEEAEIQLVTMFAVSEFSSICPDKCLFDNFTDLVWSQFSEEASQTDQHS